MLRPCLARTARARLVTLSLLGLAATRATAQDTAVVFVHGIQSDGYVWNHALTSIVPGLRVNPVKPSLEWRFPVAQQVAELSSLLNATPATSDTTRRMPFVTHSNGGLVARDYSRAVGRVRQLATVATPHLGAFLANSWLNYDVPALATYMMDALYAPIHFHHEEDFASPEIIDLAYYAMYPFFQLANGLDAAMCPVAGLCLVWTGANWVAAPIAVDLAEGSAVTDPGGRLNTPANLAREASGATAISPRIGLWTSSPAEGVLFDLLGLHRPTWIDGRDITIALYLQAYQHYHQHWDPWLVAQEWLWVDGMIALMDMDANWQALIGTLYAYQREVQPDFGIWYWS